jgi:hypothetical protein
MSDYQKNRESNLPAPIDNDFDAGGSNVDRTIQGSIIKCIDGRWVDRDGSELPVGTKMLVLATTEVLQHFQDGKLIEEIKKKPFPNLDGLNKAIPVKQWSKGINGPRPPWSHQHIVYLVNTSDAAIYTSINNTKGQEIAVQRLTSKVKWMRRLRNENVSPVVQLDAKPMPTQNGPKMRPEFTVVEWRDLSGGGLVETRPTPLPPAQGIEHIGKPVKPVTTKEEFDDEIAF